jgi:hypothetical protein
VSGWTLKLRLVTLAAQVLCAAIVSGLILSASGTSHAERSAALGQQSTLNFTITAKAEGLPTPPPSAPTTEASSTAVNALMRDSGNHFVGYVQVSCAVVPGLTQVSDAAGNVWYRVSPPANGYVFFYTAPPQSGYRYISALAVVNMGTGVVDTYQIRASNDAKDALPGGNPAQRTPASCA